MRERNSDWEQWSIDTVADIIRAKIACDKALRKEESFNDWCARHKVLALSENKEEE